MMVPAIVILPGLLGLALLPMHLVGEGQAVRRRAQLQRSLAADAGALFGTGAAGAGHHRADRRFYVGHGGQRERVRDGVDLRYLSRARSGRMRRIGITSAMGRWCTVVGVLVSIGTAYFVMQFQSIMDYVQALFSFFIAPLFGTVILGMLWKRATPAGGFWGLLSGTVSSIAMWAWVKADPAALRYIALSPSAKDMAENMYRALWCWIVCVAVTVIVSMATRPKPEAELERLSLRVHEDSIGGPFAAVQTARILGRHCRGGFRGAEHYFLVDGFDHAQTYFGVVFCGVVTIRLRHPDHGRRSAGRDIAGGPHDRAGEPSRWHLVGRRDLHFGHRVYVGFPST